MTQKLKILHLEDLASDAELIERELKKSNIQFELLLVGNKQEFENAIKEFNPEIILSDHSLPSFSSIEALRIVKSKGIKIPFILITATVSEEFAVSIIKEGADDYILKDRLQRLPSAILNAIKKKQLEHEREKYFNEIIASREELKAAHERLLFHIENSPLGFIEWDNNIRVKSWSKRAEEIFGWTEKEFIESKKTGLSQVYEGDLLLVKKIADELADGTVERNTAQHRNYTKDGRVIWCEWFNSALKNADGKVIAIMSLVQDITENKNAEESLKNSEQRFREIFETAPEAIVVFNIQTQLFSRYNANALKLLKCSGEELLKKSPYDISSPFQPDGKSARKKSVQYISAALNGEKPTFEWTVLDAKRQELICEVRLVKLSGADNNEVLATFVDITERRNTEKMREKITADLVQHNKDLQQFAYIISHNLRAPVANIIGLTTMFEEPSLNQKMIKEIIRNLASSAVKLDNVIIDLNHILNLRSEVNERKVIVRFSEIVEDIKLTINSAIKQEGIWIKTDFSQVPEIFSLKSYIYSIFHNLIYNSIKYKRPDLSAIIEIRSFRDYNNIFLVFKDNGLGIDLTKKGDQVFGLYKRFHSHVEGKGMGLFMVKTAVEMLKGTISVASSVDKGAIFTIQFPSVL